MDIIFWVVLLVVLLEGLSFALNYGPTTEIVVKKNDLKIKEKYSQIKLIHQRIIWGFLFLFYVIYLIFSIFNSELDSSGIRRIDFIIPFLLIIVYFPRKDSEVVSQYFSTKFDGKDHDVFLIKNQLHDFSENDEIKIKIKSRKLINLHYVSEVSKL